MKVYLVRHGRTGGNVAKRHQSNATPLDELGREQAKKMAQTIVPLKPTHIITSTFVRAIETAREIGAVTDIIPETNETFKEIMRPKKLEGYHHFSLKSFLFYGVWYLGLSGGEGDAGESYKTFRTRIIKARQHLETYPKDAVVVVVSHTVFINFFIAHLCQDRPLTPWQAVRWFIGVFKVKNTQVIPLIYQSGESSKKCNWVVDRSA
jgi:broad specificity phosphatase PhoE